MSEEEANKLKGELEQCKKQNEEYLNSWKRAAADFDNFRKRKDKENQELVIFAREMTVVTLLPSLEALEQALIQRPNAEHYEEWKKGVEKIHEELAKSLKKLGVEKIGIVGEQFNHEVHEAVEAVEDKEREGQVIEVLQTGYKINEKVIRPAKVKVAR